MTDARALKAQVERLQVMLDIERDKNNLLERARAALAGGEANPMNEILGPFGSPRGESSIQVVEDHDCPPGEVRLMRDGKCVGFAVGYRSEMDGVALFAPAPRLFQPPFGELGQWVMLGRFGKPQEVADLVLYLASPASDLVCGETILIDGGFTAL